MPNHSRFDLAYSCVGRYVGWTKLHSHVFGLIPSLERVHTSISISKKFKLRAPAVHGVSSNEYRKCMFVSLLNTKSDCIPALKRYNAIGREAQNTL